MLFDPDETPHDTDDITTVLAGESSGSFVEASLRGDRCAVLSLFCVFGPDDEPQVWQGSAGMWSIDAPGGVDVNVSSEVLFVADRDGNYEWTIPRSMHRQ